MANIIKIKNKTTSGAPTALQMATKELVFNEVDNKLYYKKESDDSVIHINQNSGGTVTSIGISIGVSGSDINISGSPITTSGSITVNILTASATNRGALSSSDWTTFNSKISGTGSTGRVPFFDSSSSISSNSNFTYQGGTGTLTAPYIKATSSGGTATTVTGRDSNNIISNITIGSQLALSSGTLNTTGFSGTFKTGDAKIVTVVNGIITSVV